MNNKEREEIDEHIRKAELDAAQSRTQVIQQDIDRQMEGSESNLAETQLDTSKDLLNFYYQLNGYILTPDERLGGELVWKKDIDNDLSFLSQAGINFCFWMVQGYLTKNTLLSNYDDVTINAKMEDVSTTIADTLFMKYDTYFKYPTLEECRKEIEERIQRKTDIRKFAKDILGIKSDEAEIKKEIIKEIEDRIEKELETIKNQQMKDKLKMYDAVQRLIQDTIHSAYQRAWKGQERTTIRQHFHISENRGGYIMPKEEAAEGILSKLRRRR